MSADSHDKTVTFLELETPSSPLRPPRTTDREAPLVPAEDATEDPTINQQPLDVYLHYADKERRREASDHRPVPDAPWTVFWKRITGEGVAVTPKSESQRPQSPTLLGWGWTDGVNDVPHHGPASPNASHYTSSDKHQSTTELATRDVDGSFILTPREAESAYRLMRTASWQVVFFLIVSDMMGWFTAPQAFKLLGYGPGILVFTLFFLLAFASGQILWKLYLALDSERYPVKSYADIAERTFGGWAKYVFNFFQSAQLLVQVGMFLIMDGKALSQIINFKFCFLALNVFFASAGFALSQSRMLRTIAIITNLNFYLNVGIMILTMFGVAMYDPVPSESSHKDLGQPVKVSGWVGREAAGGWYQQVGAVQLCVFAYGGATIFTEFMVEMRRPADFWKAALWGQFICYLTYMFFGLFCYSMQGQYTAILPTVNIANIAFQAVTNIIGMFCLAVTAILYAHIGAKVVYRVLSRGLLGAPSLSSKKSAVWWSGTTALYWVLAWVIGSAIPNISDLNTVIGSAFILQMTYTFPPVLLLGHWIQKDAMAGDYPWRPGMEPYANRSDSWRDISRWRRGFAAYWYAKVALIILVAGSLSLAGVGVYAGVMQAKASYEAGVTVAYSCKAPGQVF